MIPTKNVIQEKYLINRITTELNKLYHYPPLMRKVPILENQPDNPYNSIKVSEALFPDGYITTSLILDKTINSSRLAKNISFSYPPYIRNIDYSTSQPNNVLSVEKIRQMVEGVFVNFDVEEITGNATEILTGTIGTAEIELDIFDTSINSIFQPSWVVDSKILDYSVVGSKLAPIFTLPSNTSITTSSFTPLRPATSQYFFNELANLRGTTQPFQLNTLRKLAESINGMQTVDFADYVSVGDFKTSVETLPFQNIEVRNDFDTLLALSGSLDIIANNRIQSIANYQNNISWTFGYINNAMSLGKSVIEPRFSAVETKLDYIESRRTLLKNEVYAAGWVNSSRLANSLQLSTEVALPNSNINLSDSSEKIVSTAHVKNMLMRDIYGNIDTLRTIQKLATMVNSDMSYSYNVANQIGELNTQNTNLSLKIDQIGNLDSRETSIKGLKTQTQLQNQQVNSIQANYLQYSANVDSSMQWILSQSTSQSIDNYEKQVLPILDENSGKINISAFYSLVNKFDSSFANLDERIVDDGLVQTIDNSTAQLDDELATLSLKTDSSLSLLYTWKNANTANAVFSTIIQQVNDVSVALYDASMTVESIRGFSADASSSIVEQVMFETIQNIQAYFWQLENTADAIGILERNVVELCDTSLNLIVFPSLESFDTYYQNISTHYESLYGNTHIMSDNSLNWYSLYVDAYDSHFKSRHVLADTSMVSLREGVIVKLAENTESTIQRIVGPSFNDLFLKNSRETIDHSLNAIIQRNNAILNNNVWEIDLSLRDNSLNPAIELASSHDGSLNTVVARQWEEIGENSVILPSNTVVSSATGDVSGEIVSTSWTKKELASVVGLSPDSLNSLVEMYHAIGTSIELTSVNAVFQDISSNLNTQNGRLNGLSSAGLQEFNVDASITLLENMLGGFDSCANLIDASFILFSTRVDNSLGEITRLLVLPYDWISSVDSSLNRLRNKEFHPIPQFDNSFSALFERMVLQKNNAETIRGNIASIFPTGYFNRFDLSGIQISSTAAFETRVDSSLAFLQNKYTELDSSLSSVGNGIRNRLRDRVSSIHITDYSSWISTTNNTIESIRNAYDISWNSINNSLNNGVDSYGSLDGEINTYSGNARFIIADSSLVDSSLNYFQENAWIQSMNSSVVLPTGVAISGDATDTSRPQTTGYVKKQIVGVVNNAPVALNTIGKLAAALSESGLVNTIQTRLTRLDTSLNSFNYNEIIERLDSSFTQVLPVFSNPDTEFQRMRVNDISTNLADTQLKSINTKVETGIGLSLSIESKLSNVASSFSTGDSSLGIIVNKLDTQDDSHGIIKSGIESSETIRSGLPSKLTSNDISTNLLMENITQNEISIYNLFNLLTKPYNVSGIAGVNSITVSFSPPLVASAFTVYLYKIYVSGGGNTSVYNITNTTSSYVVSGLTQDTNYTIYVEAVTEYITVSSSSIVVKTDMGGVSGLQATANTPTSINISYNTNAGASSYTWTAVPDLAGYATRTGTVGGTVGAVSIGSLSSGVVYTISVVANGATGTSTASTIVYGTRLVAPSVAATDNTTTSISVGITGPAVGTVSKYTWSAVAAGFATVVGEFASGSTSGVLTGLDSGAVYTVSVVAVGLYGNSAAGVVTYGTRLLAPSSLAATANTTASISISYVAPAVGTVTKYSWTAVPDIEVASLGGDLSANVLSYIIPGMTAGAIYTIGVSAVGLYGSSSVSQITYGTRLPAPTGVSATSTADSITVNYGIAANIQQNVEKFVYELYQDATFVKGADISANVYSQFIDGLTGATDYSVGVYAVNLYGNSATSSVLVATKMGAPTGLTATSSTSTSITISFTRPSGTITQFDWRARPTAGGTTLTGNFTTGGTSGTITGLSSGVEYGISIAAIGPTYSSNYSSEVIYGTVPDAPTGLTYTSSNTGTINFTWTAVTGANSYNAGAKSITLGTETTKTNIMTNIVSMTGLSSGRIYDLSVAAVGTYGTSAYSTRLRNSTSFALPTTLLTSIGVTDVSMTVRFNSVVTGDISGLVLTTTPATTQYAMTLGTSSRVITELTPATAYTIILDASNLYTTRKGTYSGVAGTVFSTPSTPVFVSRSLTDLSFSVTGTTKPFTRYNISYRSLDGTVSSTTDGSSNFKLSLLNSGKIYDVSVNIQNAFGVSRWSPVVRNSTNLIALPTLSVGVIGLSTIDVSFSSALPTQDCSYILRTDPNVNQYVLAAGATSRQLTGLAEGTFYQIILDASNGFAPKLSNNISATTTSPPLGPTTLNTIATYLRGYMTEFRNSNFWAYRCDGNTLGNYIMDGGLDMFDSGNIVTPWLLSGERYDLDTTFLNAYPSRVNYSTVSQTVTDTNFNYISLGWIYEEPTSYNLSEQTDKSRHPITLLGFRNSGPVGWQIGGGIGADGEGTATSGYVYSNNIVNGFTVYAGYRQVYGAGTTTGGDPTICHLVILLGRSSWGSVFGPVTLIANNSDKNYCQFVMYAGTGSVNILGSYILLSKNRAYNTTAIPNSELQTIVGNFTNRINLALGL